jgi:hypothetical protein
VWTTAQIKPAAARQATSRQIIEHAPTARSYEPRTERFGVASSDDCVRGHVPSGCNRVEWAALYNLSRNRP